MTKTLIRFFTIADYEEEEAWLRSLHNQGWKLSKMTPPCFFTFEECEPEDVIYRLDYKNAAQTEEYMQMLKDFGWEHCGQCLGWLYFRKSADAVEAEQDGQLFSDDASRVELVRHVARTRLLPLAIIFLCCVVPNFLRYAMGRQADAIDTFFAIFFGVMFVVYVFLMVYCGVKLTKIRAKYENR